MASFGRIKLDQRDSCQLEVAAYKYPSKPLLIKGKKPQRIIKLLLLLQYPHRHPTCIIQSEMMARNLTLNSTMRGVMWEGELQNVAIRDIPVPNITESTDALVRVRYAGICGTDIHITNGYSPREDAAWSLGHEAMGIVEYIGNAVNEVSVGDYVVVPDGVHTASFAMVPEEMEWYATQLGGAQCKSPRVPLSYTVLKLMHYVAIS